MKLLIKTTFIIILLLSNQASAQFLPKKISLLVSPSSPSPGQSVTITAGAPLFDKSSTYFDWTVNGKARSDFSGFGKDIIKLTAGNIGSSINVSVAATDAKGEIVSKSASIPVSDLSLTWFSQTYTPKWYKGKALPIQNSIIEVAAIPEVILNGARINPKNLVYKWSLDGIANLLNGVGQNVFEIKTNIRPANSYTVEVIIEDKNGQFRKTGRISIKTQSPKVLVYPFSPLGGVEQYRGLELFPAEQKGLFDFIAEPFFLVISSPKELDYEWRLNGNAIAGTPLNPNLLTVDTAAGQDERVRLSVTVNSKDQFVSAISKTFSIFLR